METPRAIVLGAVIVGGCVLALLGYIATRDHTAAEAASEIHQQEFTESMKAEYEASKARLHGLRLDAYERRFGHVERLRLEAFEYGVRVAGTETTCRGQKIAHPRCAALDKNRLALYESDAPFVNPPR